MPEGQAIAIAIADHVGRNALAYFALLLLVALGAGWGLERFLHLHDPQQGPERTTASSAWPWPPRLLLNLLIGFALVVAGATTFVELAEGLGDQEGELGAFDDRLGLALAASLPAPALEIFATITHLGDTETLWSLGIGVALLLLATGRLPLALAWSVSLAGNGVLTRVLKNVFERVRPEHDVALATAEGWSFPSGHTSGAVVAYGLLAYLAWRLLPPAWRLPSVLAAMAIAISVGCSRIFLQVHHASDVLAGWASGGVWLVISIGSIELARGAARRRAGARG